MAWFTITSQRLRSRAGEAQKTELEMIYDILAFEFVKVRASTGGNDTANVAEPLNFDLLFEDGWGV